MRKIFTHKPVTLPELTAVHVDGKRYYVTPAGAKYKSVSTVVGSINKEAIKEWLNDKVTQFGWFSLKTLAYAIFAFLGYIWIVSHGLQPK